MLIKKQKHINTGERYGKPVSQYIQVALLPLCVPNEIHHTQPPRAMTLYRIPNSGRSMQGLAIATANQMVIIASFPTIGLRRVSQELELFGLKVTEGDASDRKSTRLEYS